MGGGGVIQCPVLMLIKRKKPFTFRPYPYCDLLKNLPFDIK